ncbi:MAG: glycine/sarcosine/betaine reductase selenoprotein B family protein [Chloroflexota bacterium]
MEAQLQYQVDSYRFLERAVKKMVRSWIRMEQPREIPWTPLRHPPSECTVALISSAGLALKTDRPFDQAGERANPWWGDPSFRVLPKDATGADVNLYHMHINPHLVEQDLNTLLPLQRLQELETGGEIRASSDHHYTYMGYTLQPKTLLAESVPAMTRLMQRDEVDLVILVPG